MPSGRCLIINADDFGQSRGVNRGIVKAYEDGIVTSASLMVRWPAASEAAAYGQSHPQLDLGLHLDLGECAYRDGNWVALYEVVPLDESAVAAEISSQLRTFHRLVGRDPTHIDSHQHVHLKEPVRPLLEEVARTLGIPLRHCSPTVRYCGDFYGQTATGSPLPHLIASEALINILAALPPGITELGCHPGEDGDLNTMYRIERAQEVKALCDRRVREAVLAQAIELCSFADLPDHSTFR
jgi:chitin disaccharide deacetylase